MFPLYKCLVFTAVSYIQTLLSSFVSLYHATFLALFCNFNNVFLNTSGFILGAGGDTLIPQTDAVLLK